MPSFLQRLVWMGALGAALLTIGLRFGLQQRYGNDLPFHDQWDAEGLHLLRPWLGNADLQPFVFRFHNEHHPVFTKLISLGLVKADGMWSATPQMILNTCFQAAIVLLLWRLARRHLPALLAWGVALAAAVTLSLPLLWENLLWGFQSQFYLAILFGLLHLDLTWAHPRLGWRWALGALVGLATLGTIAAGFLAVAASGFVALTQLRGTGRERTHAIATLALAIAISVAGVKMIHPVPYAAVATTPFSALEAFGVLAGWPLGFGPGSASLVLFPAGLLIVGSWLRGEKKSGQPWLLALVGWLGAATAAFAYGRAELIGGATPRYCDYFTVQIVVALICLLQFIVTQTGRARQIGAALGILWVLVLAIGFERALQEVATYDDLGERSRLISAQEKLIRKFIRTDDPKLFDDSLESRLIHESQEHRLGLLRDVGLRTILPPSIRPRYPVAAAASSEGFQATIDATEEKSWAASPATTGHDALFLSEPLKPEPFPILRLQVEGGLDGQTHLLRLVPVDGSPPIQPLSLSSRTTHQTVNFPTPSGWFRIEAKALAGSGDFRFTAPAAVSTLNRVGGKLLGLHPLWVTLGLAALALGFLAALGRPGPRPTEAKPTAPSRLQLAALLVALVAAATLLLWPRPFTFGSHRAALLYSPATWSPEARDTLSFVSTSPHRNVALDAIYPGIAPPGGFYGTYGLDGDRTVVEATSSPFVLHTDRLAVPVVGYPNQSGSHLDLLIENPNGQPPTTIPFSAGAPGERPQLWIVDVTGHRGASARLHLADNATGHQGWFGLAPPWSIHNAADILRWKRLSDSNRLDNWRLAFALTLLLASILWVFRQRALVAKFAASLRWP